MKYCVHRNVGTRRVRFALAGGLLAALLSNSLAQTARHPEPEKKSDTIVLSPFEVQTGQDTGYVAASSLAGGRADTPLKLTPASISVMTKEFMDDFNILDMRDAAAWTLNMEPPGNPNEGPFGGNNFQMNFRNTGGSANYPARNYALFYFTADSYNSERFEFSRGPNAMLFGDGGIGGMATQLTKRARFNNTFGTTNLQVDSFGGWRSTIDGNYGKDKFAVRVNGLLQDRKSYQDGTFAKTKAFDIAMSYKLTNSTVVNLEFERHHERALQWRRTYGEQASLWDRVTVNETNNAIANPNNFGLEQVSGNADYWLFNFGSPEAGVLNYRGNQYRTRGLGYQMPWEGRSDIPRFARPPSKEFNLGPADATMQRTLGYKAINVEHTFNDDTFVRLGYVRHDFGPHTEVTESLASEYRIDVNKLLPNGAPNRNFGKAYADITQSSQWQSNEVEEVQLLSAYRFEKSNWFDLKQRFSLMGGWRQDRFNMWQRRWVWANNPAQSNLTNGANQVRYRIYWDQPMTSVASQVPPSVPGREYRFVNTGFSADNERDLSYGQLVSASTFFNERLSIMLGFRRDKFNEDLQSSNYDAAGNMRMGFVNPNTRVFEVGYHGRNPNTVDSRNVGGIFYLTRSHLVGLLANYSENFSIPPTGDPLIDGSTPAPPRGEVKDWGIVFNLPDNKLYGKIGYYDSQQIGQIQGGGNINDIRAIWTNLGYTDPTLTNLGYRDLRSIAARGWEVEIVANPTRNIRFTANYARPEQMTIEDSAGRIGYVEEHIAEWRAGAALATNDPVPGSDRRILNPTAISDAIRNIENSLNGIANGTMANNTVKHNTNVAATYSFTEGKLKGFSFGAGANLRGRRKNGSRDPRLKFGIPENVNPTVEQTREAAYDYLWVPSTAQYSMHASYNYRFNQKLRAKFQVNVSNLLNDDSPQWSGYGLISGNQLLNGNPRMQVVNNFTQLDPRKITFSTTLSF